jgi:hypothetical protein
MKLRTDLLCDVLAGESKDSIEALLRLRKKLARNPNRGKTALPKR